MDVAATGSFVDRLRKWKPENRVWLARGGAEVVGAVAATVGTVLVGDVLLRGPYDNVKQWVGEKVVLPHLDGFEHWMGKFQSIDTPEERAVRAQLPPEERAQRIGSKLMDIFGLPMVMGMVGQFWAQSYGIKTLGLASISAKENRMAFVCDKAAMGAAIGALNFVVPAQSEQMQDRMEGMFKRIGFSQQSADSLASMAVNWHLPNFVGLLTSVLMLNRAGRS